AKQSVRAVLPVASVVRLHFSVWSPRDHSDVCEIAQAALHHPAQQVLIAGVPFPEEEIRFQRGLRPAPDLFGNDRRDLPADDLAILVSAPLTPLMVAHVGRADDQVPHPARAPDARGPALPLTAEHQTIIPAVGARHSDPVQVVSDVLAGSLL